MNDQPTLSEAVMVGILLSVPGALLAWIVFGLVGIVQMNGI
ncbi:MAG: hypothetical protein R3F61_30985 [Myxococcota bacterium]